MRTVLFWVVTQQVEVIPYLVKELPLLAGNELPVLGGVITQKSAVLNENVRLYQQVLLLLTLQSFDWLAAFHLGLSIFLHRVPPQVADRGTLYRYRGYWGNKIPRADLKTDLRRATQR